MLNKIFKKYLLCFVCVSVLPKFLSVPLVVLWLQMLENSIASPGTVVIDNCELQCGSRTRTWVLCNNNYSKLLSLLSGSWNFYSSSPVLCSLTPEAKFILLQNCLWNIKRLLMNSTYITHFMEIPDHFNLVNSYILNLCLRLNSWNG